MYGDESADEAKERVVAVAGVVGHEDEWQDGIRKWLRITRGLPFHATDLESAHDKTAEPEKHAADLKLYRDLTVSLRENHLVGFAVALDLQAHREVFPPAEDGTDVPADWAYYKALTDVIN